MGRRLLPMVLAIVVGAVALGLWRLEGSGAATGSVSPSRSGGPQAANVAQTIWYVALGGADGDTCAAPTAPCLSIDAAVGKASAGDTIEVAAGTYVGSGTEVVLVGKDVTLSGGWNSAFTDENGVSTIDGQAARTGVRVSGAMVRIVRCVVENGGAGMISVDGGAGISVDGAGAALVLDKSTVRDNANGGVQSSGLLMITDSSISGNASHISNAGGGVTSGSVTLTNTTMSGNSAGGGRLVGGGVLLGTLGLTTAQFSNVTITGNDGSQGGGVRVRAGSTLVMRNSIVAGNTATIGRSGHQHRGRGNRAPGLGRFGWLQPRNRFHACGRRPLHLCAATRATGGQRRPDADTDPVAGQSCRRHRQSRRVPRRNRRSDSYRPARRGTPERRGMRHRRRRVRRNAVSSTSRTDSH